MNNKVYGDFTCAFPGWYYYDWKINHKNDYLNEKIGNKKKIKSKNTNYSDENTVKNLQKRYYLLFNTPNYFTFEQWELIINYYCTPAFLCLSCGDKSFLVPDHVVSVSQGGSNSIMNIQPLCQRCNSRKRSEIIDFRPDKGAFAELISYL